MIVQVVLVPFKAGTYKERGRPRDWRLAPMKVPVDIEKYMQCEWRSANMCLLDFLQRSDREGNIHSSLKQRYKQTSAGSTLEEFANRCSTNGTVMVAAVKYSRRNSSFYKQWLLLHVPFRQVDDLWNEAVEAVPPELQGSALCLLHRPRFWRSMPAICQEMELESLRDSTIENILEAVKAARRSSMLTCPAVGRSPSLPESTQRLR